jgi:hypothetical protein
MRQLNAEPHRKLTLIHSYLGPTHKLREVVSANHSLAVMHDPTGRRSELRLDTGDVVEFATDGRGFRIIDADGEVAVVYVWGHND